jgi:hypothetical protein
MSNYKIQVSIKVSNGNLCSYDTEVSLPDYLDSKIGSSSFKQDIIKALEAALPQMLGGSDWRKRGGKLESFNNVRKQ